MTQPEIKLPPFPDGMCLREDIEDYARAAVEADRAALLARIEELEANRHKWMCIADERAVAVADLRVKLAEAQKDSARLDWLEHQNAILESDAWTVLGHDCTAEEGFRKYWVGANLRSAIDAAMEAKP